jgi:hypothetical protein
MVSIHHLQQENQLVTLFPHRYIKYVPFLYIQTLNEHCLMT